MKAIQILPETTQNQLNKKPPPDFFIDDDYYYKYSEDGRAVSEEEYWEKYYIHPDYNYEWNNGYLEVKPRLLSHDGIFLYVWFFELIKTFIKRYPVAKLLDIKTGFKQLTKEKKPIHKIEMGVILNTNPVPSVSEDFSYSGICDICIELFSYLSSKEIRHHTVEKKKEYETAGVKEYFVLDDKGIDTSFSRLNSFGVYENIKTFDGDIICSKVLPGFRFRISDLYNQPSKAKMAEDDVYKSFIMSEYQAEKLRADKLAAKLKELGISPDDI